MDVGDPVAVGRSPADLTLRIGGDRAGRGLLIPLRPGVLHAGALVIALHVALTAWRVSRSWWWQDDLNMIAKASHRALPGLLLQGYNGHLMPANWALAWLVGNRTHFAWWPAAVELTVLVAAVDVALLAVLVRLFGPRRAVLLPLALACCSGIPLVSTVWWAAGSQWLPACLSLLLAFRFHLGHLATGSRRDAVAAVASVLGGLLFFEKALTVAVVLAGYTVLYAVDGPVPRRPWRALRRYRGYWAAHCALIVGWALLYALRVRTERAPARTSGEVVALAGQMVLHNLVPSMIGGPLRWYGQISALPTPPGWFLAVSWAVAALAVAGSLLLRRAAWRAWILLAAWIAVAVALVAATRLAVIGPTLGRDGRYLTDVVPLTAICLGLAWLPVRGELDRARPPAPTGDRAGRRPGGSPAVLAVAAALAVAACGAVSARGWDANWSSNPSRAYVTRLQRDLDVAAAFGATPVMLDQRLPEAIMIPAFGADGTLSNLTRPMDHRPAFRDWTDRLTVVSGTGSLVPGRVAGARTALPVGAACAASGRGTAVRLAGGSGVREVTIRLGYLASRDTGAVVGLGAGRVRVRFTAGLHELFVRLVGGGGEVTVAGLAAGTAVCIGEVDAGTPVPAL